MTKNDIIHTVIYTALILTILVLFLYIYWLKNHPTIVEKEITKIETVEKHSVDTVFLPQERLKYVYSTIVDTMYLEAPETLFIESKQYKDEFAEISISGIYPKLDSVRYFLPRDTVFTTVSTEHIIKNDSWWRNRFTVNAGVMAGYSPIYNNFDMIVGVGVGIRIW